MKTFTVAIVTSGRPCQTCAAWPRRRIQPLTPRPSLRSAGGRAGANPISKALARPAGPGAVQKVFGMIATRRPCKDIPLDQPRNWALFETAHVCGARAGTGRRAARRGTRPALSGRERPHPRQGWLGAPCIAGRPRLRRPAAAVSRPRRVDLGPVVWANINGSSGSLSCDASHHRWYGYCEVDHAQNCTGTPASRSGEPAAPLSRPKQIPWEISLFRSGLGLFSILPTWAWSSPSQRPSSS